MFGLFTKTPTTPRIPVAISSWYGDSDNTSALRECIDNEIVKVAIASLKEAHRPNSMSVKTDDNLNSKSLAYYAGYCDALDDLIKLTTRANQTQVTNPSLKPWTHAQPQ